MPEKKFCTYQDICNINDENQYELIGGEICIQSAPLPEHIFTCAKLHTALSNFLSGKACRALRSPVDVFLFNQPNAPENAINYALQPDIVVICDPKQKGRCGVYGPPKLIAEVLSDSSVSHDRVTKYRLYEQAGVEEYWIVDPKHGTVSVFRLDDEKYVPFEVYTKDMALHSDVFPTLSIDLADMFSAS